MGSIISRMGELFNPGGFILKFFLGILVLLLLLLSFFLGRVTKFLEMIPSFTFESKAEEDRNYEQEKNNLFGKISNNTIVASKNGKKYYFVWCSGAGNIKASSKRYFTTEELAQKAGYVLANNCK